MTLIDDGMELFSMDAISIRGKDRFRIEDELNGFIWHGSNQDWYTKKWQRMAGCGPSTVTNMIYYHLCNQSNTTDTNLTKEACLRLMNDIWKDVTPGLGGVSSTTMLYKGIQQYIKRQNHSLTLDALDIPKKKEQRPELSRVVRFIGDALSKDSPVAFLNLEHGAVKELESWHWVTIISMEYDLEKSYASVTILDSGLVKTIDLSCWLTTTKLGGGFVSAT